MQKNSDAEWASAAGRRHFARDLLTLTREEFLTAKRYVDDVIMASWWLCPRCLGEQIAETFTSLVFELQDPPPPSSGAVGKMVPGASCLDTETCWDEERGLAFREKEAESTEKRRRNAEQKI